MIEKEDILLFMEKEASKPVALAEIGEYFRIEEGHYDSLREVLETLEDEGRIVRVRKGKYALPERLNMLVGRLQGHPRGYGFVLVEGGDDVYIPADRMHGAMHNDRVLIKIKSAVLAGKSREGEVVRILPGQMNSSWTIPVPIAMALWSRKKKDLAGYFHSRKCHRGSKKWRSSCCRHNQVAPGQAQSGRGNSRSYWPQGGHRY